MRIYCVEVEATHHSQPRSESRHLYSFRSSERSGIYANKRGNQGSDEILDLNGDCTYIISSIQPDGLLGGGYQGDRRQFVAINYGVRFLLGNQA